LIQFPGGKDGTFTIPESVTAISNNAFYACNNLTSITIPANVTSSEHAFYSCMSLTSIIVDSGNQYYASEGGILYNKAKTELFYVPNGITSVTIPASITSIRGNAFYNCRSLTSITIPASVTSIGSGAFESCDELISVTFAAGSAITSENFSDDVFGIGDYNNTFKTAYLAGGAGTYKRYAGNNYWWKE